MNKNRIRLTESQLHNVIKECVERVLNEGNYYSEDPTWNSFYHQDMRGFNKSKRRKAEDSWRKAVNEPDKEQAMLMQNFGSLANKKNGFSAYN